MKEWKVRVHHEEGAYWAEVIDLPGCFASGDTLDELIEALSEAVTLYLDEDGQPAPVDGAIEIAELTMAAPAQAA